MSHHDFRFWHRLSFRARVIIIGCAAILLAPPIVVAANGGEPPIIRVPSGDVPALIAAVETANSIGGAKIVLEAGVYDIDQSLPDIESPIEFISGGKEQTHLLNTTFLVRGDDSRNGKLRLTGLSVENVGCRSIARITGSATFDRVGIKQNLTGFVYDNECELQYPGVQGFQTAEITVQSSVFEATTEMPLISLFEANSEGRIVISDSFIAGGVDAAREGTTIQKSTVDSAESGGYGAGMDIRESYLRKLSVGISSSVNLINSTVSQDINVWRDGTFNAVNLTAGGRVFLSSASHGGRCSVRNSLVGDAGEGDGGPCAFDNSLVGAFDDLLVGDLRDNGEPGGRYYPLLTGSPAIDAGMDELCTDTDQLGHTRVDGDGDGLVTCDLGAVEFVGLGSQLISMDYAPNDPTNRTSANSTGNIGVYLFGNASFSVSDVALNSLRLGLGDALALEGLSQKVDGNGDVYPDLLARFSIPELEINCAQKDIELRGTTTNGGPFSGVDFIRPKGCTTALMNFKPNDPSNSVNPSSDRLVGVYIFGTQKGQGEPGNIDATSIVIDSIRMGPALADTGGLPWRIADFDGDGDKDLLVRFRIPDLGLSCGDTEIELGGQSENGRAFGAKDWVNVVSCK